MAAQLQAMEQRGGKGDGRMGGGGGGGREGGRGICQCLDAREHGERGGMMSSHHHHGCVCEGGLLSSQVVPPYSSRISCAKLLLELGEYDVSLAPTHLLSTQG